MFESILKIVFGERPPVSMELLKIALQAIVTVGVFFLGVYYEHRRKAAVEEKTLSNIRKILHKELKHNYRLIIRHTPREKPIKKLHRDILVDLLKDELPSSVYEKYLGRLAELPTGEMDKIYNAYTHIKECVEIGRQTREYIERSDIIKARVKAEIIVGVDLAAIEESIREQVAAVIEHCEAALSSISEVFEDGVEDIESLQKERGKAIEAVDKYMELTGENTEEQ